MGGGSRGGWVRHASLQVSALIWDLIGIVNGSSTLEYLVTVLLGFRLWHSIAATKIGVTKIRKGYK